MNSSIVISPSFSQSRLDSPGLHDRLESYDGRVAVDDSVLGDSVPVDCLMKDELYYSGSRVMSSIIGLANNMCVYTCQCVCMPCRAAGRALNARRAQPFGTDSRPDGKVCQIGINRIVSACVHAGLSREARVVHGARRGPGRGKKGGEAALDARADLLHLAQEPAGYLSHS